MKDSQGYYSLKEEEFSKKILPLLLNFHQKSGRPPLISHYQFFNALLYVLGTGIPWRDLPELYGNWHTIYTRFKSWSDKGWLWNLLYELQSKRKLTFDMAWINSTNVSLHRDGSSALKK